MLKRIVIIIGMGVWMLRGGWDYRIVSPLAGTLGTIRIDKREKGKHYRIDVEVQSRGLAALLTGDRREHYRSEGVVLRGVLKSRHLTLERQTKKKRQIDTYRIETVHKKVFRHRIRWKKGHMDENSTTTLPYYSEEDLLTLYFNVLPKIMNPKSGTHWEILTVGAEKIKGKVLIDRLTGKAADKARKDLKVGPDFSVILLYSPQKIAGKRNRRFTAALDRKGFPVRIRFVAIPVVGEILIERVQK